MLAGMDRAECRAKLRTHPLSHLAVRITMIQRTLNWRANDAKGAPRGPDRFGKSGFEGKTSQRSLAAIVPNDLSARWTFEFLNSASAS